jgi:hypothetical protein
MNVEPSVLRQRECARSHDLVEARHHHRVKAELVELEAGVLVVDAPCPDERDAEMVGDPAQRVVAEDGRMCAGRRDDADRVDIELEQPQQERQAEVRREAGERDAWTVARRDRVGGRREIPIRDEREHVARPQFVSNHVEVFGRGGHVN